MENHINMDDLGVPHVRKPPYSQEQGVNVRHLSAPHSCPVQKLPSLQHDTVRVVLFEFVREITLVLDQQDLTCGLNKTSHWGYTMIYRKDYWEISPRMYNIFLYSNIWLHLIFVEADLPRVPKEIAMRVEKQIGILPFKAILKKSSVGPQPMVPSR